MTLQKPKLIDYRQKGEQVEEWTQVRLLAIKKAEQGQSQLAYQHKARMYLLPSVGYNYAPCEERPVIRANSKNNNSKNNSKNKLKLSLSVVITAQAYMSHEVRQGSFNGAAIVHFIKKINKQP